MFLLILKQLSPALFFVVFRPSVRRSEACASSSDNPIAVSTWDGSADEEAQAEPDGAQIPCASSIIRRELPSTYSNEKFALPGRRFW